MYCYVQEIQMKNSNSVGCGKELHVCSSKWTVNGISYEKYGYEYSKDTFERPIKTAYKVSIHGKSYRDDNGKVRKKQYYISTIKYYDLVDYSWTDCIISNVIYEIAKEMDIDSEIVWDEISKKLDSLQEKVNAEFQQTEEYKTKVKQEAIIKKYNEAKAAFAKKYEIDEREYDYCYDIFAVLRNTEYLKKIKREYKSKKEYEEKSRSYQQEYNSNYNSYSGYGMDSFHTNAYSEKEKEYLKKFYRVLAVKYHPDVTGETETMQFINKLKEEWGV